MDKNKFPHIEEEPINWRSYIFKVLRFWYVFPITVLISVIICFFVIKTKTPVYRVGSKILVENEQSLMDPNVILQNTTNPFSIGDYKIRNEIEILSSYELTKRTVSQLDFFVSYYIKGKYRDVELYGEIPFVVWYDSLHVQPVGIDFFIEKINENKYRLWSEGENVNFYLYENDTYSFIKPEFKFDSIISNQELISNDLLRLRINDYNIKKGEIYKFRLKPLRSVIAEFNRIKVENIKYSSVIKLEYEGHQIKKSIDYLNKFIEVYLNRGVEKKNLVAINTIKFIDSQIYDIADSLKSAEKKLQRYRSTQKVMNIDFQAQKTYESLENLQNQKAELILKQKYYRYLQEYLTKNEDIQELIAPSSMGVNDPLLNNLIIELTRLYAEKVDVMLNTKKDNPYLESVNAKINNQKNTLEENVINSIDRTRLSLIDIDERIEKLTLEVQSLPETQRRLLNYEREFQLHDALYTFLLRKKSEMQIAKASNFPENEIIDYPKLLQNSPTSPNSKVIYLMGLLLGFGIPILIILLFDYFNDKIVDLNEVEKIIDFPIIGNIIHSKESNPFVVHNFPNSVIAESFRSLRTNFQYVLGDNNCPIIMITSTMMEEGKSFVSVNLASSFALYNKKVLLLSFDLRRPTVSKLFGFDKNEGLSNYLSGSCELKDVILDTNIPNLSIITTGPIPPNPSELIASERTNEMFELLKKEFDYIIIDTPPIGIVSDALLLERYVDKSIFIIRHKYSRKRMISHLFSSLEKKEVNNINLVINDINMKRIDYNYNYGYGYGYGYEYKTK